MKYVKLFESWLNTINEKIEGKFYEETLKYQLDNEASYTSTRESLAKHITKLIDQLTKGDVKLNSKVTPKEIILSDDQGQSFTFRCEKSKNFGSIPRLVIDGLQGSQNAGSEDVVNILSIEGKAAISGDSNEKTTLAQFIDGVLGGNHFGDSNPKDAEDAIEGLLQSSMGKKPVVTGKTGKKNVSKMTVDGFKGLTDKQILMMFDGLSKIGNAKAFNIVRNGDYYFVNLNEKFAKEKGIEFDKYSDGGSSDLGGRHLVFQLQLSAAKPEESISNIPVVYGMTNYKDSTGFGGVSTAAEKTNVRSQTTVYAGGTFEKGTLASIIFGLRKFVEDGLKDEKGKNVAGSVDLLTAMTDQIEKTNPKDAEDAWKKEGSPADMTLRADDSKEAMA